MRMGSACCIAARDRTLQNRTSGEALQRTIRYSPSWSHRWDNRGRVANNVDYPLDEYSHGISRSIGFNTKGGRDMEFSDISDGGSPMENFQTPTPQMTPASDLSKGNSFSTEVKDFVVSPAFADPLVISSKLVSKVDPLSSQSHSLPAGLTPSRHDYNSPKHQHSRQVSDDRVLELKSPKTSVSEGRSHVPSSFSNEPSSDVWSMFAFSELVASTQRDRWSLDSRALDFANGNVMGSNNGLLASPSIDTQTCVVCSKLLTQRSPWSSQKIIVSNELSVVAILVCGHVYHAECLENMTPETDRYDPPCPVCTTGDKQLFKVHRKTLTMEAADLKARNRISRSQVMDSYVESNDVVPGCRRIAGREEKSPKIGSSSSIKSSFNGPFLRRHFSLGSKSSKPIMENGSFARVPGRKGFWARYLKE